ncbi:hypothetical protein KYC_17537 [Achromobacter arsenitoxydans SY8]|uniref:Uncharacterized protein n=1 Tax=Achromobacter arsenitoxydans SY8 TaxID=477184 RepID=H0F9Q5_9BURK|nr:hypothetical protein KYC_17537 [Achromobacter arsenitoxydans SY8]
MFEISNDPEIGASKILQLRIAMYGFAKLFQVTQLDRITLDCIHQPISLLGCAVDVCRGVITAGQP